MKDFCKWLGVNEKIAKIVVWIFILMVFLIVTNTMLESVGLPYYKLTPSNLSKINTHKVLDYAFNWTIILLNFYSMVFLVFRLKEFKKIFPYSILYLVLNIIIFNVFGHIASQIFVPIFIIVFSYLYSNKNWKYIIYGIGSYIIGAFIQYICYLYKARFINFISLNNLNSFLTSLDFFLIMIMIVFIKEIVIKRKENKNGT